MAMTKLGELKRAQEQRAWRWYSIGNWLCGVGFGVAACQKWRGLLPYTWAGLGVVAVGIVVCHTLGKGRGEE